MKIFDIRKKPISNGSEDRETLYIKIKLNRIPPSKEKKTPTTTEYPLVFVVIIFFSNI